MMLKPEVSRLPGLFRLSVLGVFWRIKFPKDSQVVCAVLHLPLNCLKARRVSSIYPTQQIARLTFKHFANAVELRKVELGGLPGGEPVDRWFRYFRSFSQLGIRHFRVMLRLPSEDCLVDM